MSRLRMDWDWFGVGQGRWGVEMFLGSFMAEKKKTQVERDGEMVTPRTPWDVKVQVQASYAYGHTLPTVTGSLRVAEGVRVSFVLQWEKECAHLGFPSAKLTNPEAKAAVQAAVEKALAVWWARRSVVTFGGER